MQQQEEWVPIDIYERDQTLIRDEKNKKRPHGAGSYVAAAVKAAIQGDGVPGAGLGAAYKRAKDDIEILKSRGEKERADLIRKQYMEEKFMPAVEVAIRCSSPDELLNSRESLKALDDLVLSTGSGKGYTASYVKEAYSNLLGKDLNGDADRSDDAVVDAVRRIKILSDMDDIRAAVGIAKQIKKKIDNGDNIANEDDYTIIGRVASFGD